jgi:serine/threonine protein kinase
MGEVYRATDTRLNREVAIKILPASFANDEDRLRRFEQEALATSALNHPNILTVYDIGTHEGAPYIVAELLEGEELRKHLDHSAIPSRKAIEYSTQIASGLAAAQARGIVHRDLKPENIFITADGRVKILDFGLAKLRPQASATGSGSEVQTRKALTDRGVIMGTVGYMSPEQVRGQDTDHRADIFSFGLILYEMLAGRRAFTGESAIEAMNAILKEQPTELSETNAKTNPALEGIVRRCLEKKPEMRFHSAHDLGFELSTLTAPSGSRLETATALLPGGICGSCHSQASASLRYVCRRPTTNSAQALPRVVAGSPTNPMSPEKRKSTSGASRRPALNGKSPRAAALNRDSRATVRSCSM